MRQLLTYLLCWLGAFCVLAVIVALVLVWVCVSNDVQFTYNRWR